MEFKKIVQDLGDALVQIGWWIITIPYMFYLYITRLPIMVRMVGIELKKEKTDQFKNIISPTLFLILILIAPFACFKELFPEDVTLNFASRAAYISIVSLCFLLPASIVQVMQTKTRLSKEKFHEAFLKQCYIQPPLLLLLAAVFLIEEHTNRCSSLIADEWISTFLDWSGAILLFIYSIIETKFIFPEKERNEKFSDRMRRFIWVFPFIMTLLYVLAFFSKSLLQLMSEE